MEDEEILALFFARREQAIGELDRKYGGLCHAVALGIVGNRQEAEECVSDAYLGVWNAIPPARPCPLLPYLVKIVRHLALKAYRKQTAAKRSSRYTVAMQEIETGIPDWKTVEDEVAAKELARLIERFLDTLPQKERVIFLRRYAYLDSYAEIAARLGISEKNVSARLSQVRRKLKTYLKEREVLV